MPRPKSGASDDTPEKMSGGEEDGAMTRGTLATADVATALAAASRQYEVLTQIVADLAARLYCTECALGWRQPGNMNEPLALRYSGGASLNTYYLIRDRVLRELKKGE